MAHPAASAWKIIPQFQSLSITRTIRFYTEELGFNLGGVHPGNSTSDATFCSVFIGSKAEANIYFVKCEPGDFHPRTAMIALGTNELDMFHVQLKSAGKVGFVEPLEDKAWGYRQFSVKDEDGNILTFFTFLEEGNLGQS